MKVRILLPEPQASLIGLAFFYALRPFDGSFIRPRGLLKTDESLEVPFGSSDRRVGSSERDEPEPLTRALDRVNCALTELRVTDDAPLPESLTSHLELRLHHGEDLTTRAQDCTGGRKELLEPDKARVDHNEIDPFGQALCVQIPRVDALHHDDARIAPEPRVKLPVADIDSVDALRAMP